MGDAEKIYQRRKKENVSQKIVRKGDKSVEHVKFSHPVDMKVKRDAACGTVDDDKAGGKTNKKEGKFAFGNCCPLAFGRKIASCLMKRKDFFDKQVYYY